MGKYDSLRAYLSELSGDEVELGFDEVESLVGPLPRSARLSEEWWVNGSAVQALAWRAAGWHVRAANRDREMVTFTRGVVDGTEAAKLAPSGSRVHSSGAPHVHAVRAVERISDPMLPTAQAGIAPVETRKIWPTMLAAAVTVIGTAVITIVGLAVLARWAIFLIAIDLSAFLSLITLAITDARYRSVSLWASNACLVALLAGVAIYNLVPQNPITINVVPNADITLSSQAGSAPDLNDPNGVVLPGKKDETVTCYSVAKGAVWLYFHFSDEQSGWAPFSDFHYDPGFTHQLPFSCS